MPQTSYGVSVLEPLEYSWNSTRDYPHTCENWGLTWYPSGTMVVNWVGELTRGINSTYKLWLRKFVDHWKALSVYNNLYRLVSMLGKFWPQKVLVYASKWLNKCLDKKSSNFGLPLKRSLQANSSNFSTHKVPKLMTIYIMIHLISYRVI